MRNDEYNIDGGAAAVEGPAMALEGVGAERDPTMDLLAGPALLFGAGLLVMMGGKALLVDGSRDFVPVNEVYEVEETHEVLELPMPVPNGWMMAMPRERSDVSA